MYPAIWGRYAVWLDLKQTADSLHYISNCICSSIITTLEKTSNNGASLNRLFVDNELWVCSLISCFKTKSIKYELKCMFLDFTLYNFKPKCIKNEL